jgi:hypothetical protein
MAMSKDEREKVILPGRGRNLREIERTEVYAATVRNIEHLPERNVAVCTKITPQTSHDFLLD